MFSRGIFFFSFPDSTFEFGQATLSRAIANWTHPYQATRTFTRDHECYCENMVATSLPRPPHLGNFTLPLVQGYFSERRFCHSWPVNVALFSKLKVILCVSSDIIHANFWIFHLQMSLYRLHLPCFLQTIPNIPYTWNATKNLRSINQSVW